MQNWQKYSIQFQIQTVTSCMYYFLFPQTAQVQAQDHSPKSKRNRQDQAKVYSVANNYTGA